MPSPSLLQRLKERKLVQWALAYLAGAWVLVEATSLVVEQFFWPQSVAQVITVVAFFGFFIVLVVAWFHGDKGRQRVGGTELLLLAGVLVVAGVVLANLPEKVEESEIPEASLVDWVRPSIAVLPFHNRSGEEEDVYFTDGMHDQLITHLTNLGGLSVKGLTSVLVYRETPKNNRQIGEELNAQYLIEGGVQRAGGMVRINVQLIEAKTDHHVWAHIFDRTMSVENVFAIQTEIVEAVTDSVRVMITPEEKDRIAAIPTADLDAYELYLLGRNRWTTRSPETIREAIEYFQAAIGLDSTFARAYAGIADSYAVLPFYDLEVEPLDVIAPAKAAATRALEIDPTLGEAHAAFAYIALLYEWEFEKAERHFRAALETLPNDGSVHHRYSHALAVLGRVDEALEAAGTAFSLDPGSNVTAWTWADRNDLAGRTEEARQGYERAIRMIPPIPWAFLHLARTLAAEEPSDTLRAGELLGQFFGFFGFSSPDHMPVLVRAIAGDPDARRAAVPIFDDIVKETVLEGPDLLLTYLWAVPPEEFFDVLREAIQSRHAWVGFAHILAKTFRPEIMSHMGWNDVSTWVQYPTLRN
jgi:serine/threonine-protein kinase